MKEIFHGMKLDRYKMHSIEVVVDKLIVSESDERRLKESLRVAMKQGDGLVLVLDAETDEVRHFSRRLMDPVTGLSYSEPAPHNFRSTLRRVLARNVKDWDRSICWT